MHACIARVPLELRTIDALPLYPTPKCSNCMYDYYSVDPFVEDRQAFLEAARGRRHQTHQLSKYYNVFVHAVHGHAYSTFPMQIG